MDNTLQEEITQMAKDTFTIMLKGQIDIIEGYLRIISPYIDQTELAKMLFIIEYLKQEIK